MLTNLQGKLFVTAINIKAEIEAALSDRKGISSLEYGVLAVGIVAAVAAGAVTVGTRMTAVFAQIVTELGG